MKKFNELSKFYSEILDNLIKQDKDIEVKSVNELVEKLNNYGRKD